MKVRNKNKDIVEGIQILNRVFKKEKIKSTIDQIYADLAACRYDSASKIEEGMYNTISYLNCCQGDGWQRSDVWCRVSALYLLLTTWNEGLSKKYKGESCTDRQAFIDKIADFVLEQELKEELKEERELQEQVKIKTEKLPKEVEVQELKEEDIAKEFRRQVEIEKRKLRKEFAL
jgi:hypothetical protein